MEIALFQPDIAGNVGTTLRTAACFGVPAHIIEPCGFPFSDGALKRAGMDYATRVNVRRHADWGSFHSWIGETERSTESERSSGAPVSSRWGTIGTGVALTSVITRRRLRL